jgi:hypothetical protein
MSRIINSNNAAKVRNQNLRLIAAAMRTIGRSAAVDEQVKDLSSALVFLLREVHESAEHSASAWEKRGYWMKADRFLREWQWAAHNAANLEDVIRNDAWDLLPRVLADITPHLADIHVNKAPSAGQTWRGAYEKLLAEAPSPLPY